MWITTRNSLGRHLAPGTSSLKKGVPHARREQSPRQTRAGRERQKMVSIPPFVEGGDNQEHRPTLPSDQPNDRLFADRLRKRERKEIAHWSAGASATNYADLCPHCPLSLGTILRDPGADHSMEATGWPIRSGPAVGRLRAQRGENDGATTRGDKRRTLEDRSDPVAYRRGECKKSRNRAGGPPASSPARYKISFTSF